MSGLLYNLYADRELGLDLVPQSVYKMQSEFYPTIGNRYGVPLDTRHAYTKSTSFTSFYIFPLMSRRLGTLRGRHRRRKHPRHIPQGPGRLDQRDADESSAHRPV